MKNFNISCLDDFFINDSMAIDGVLTLVDRQMIIKHADDQRLDRDTKTYCFIMAKV